LKLKRIINSPDRRDPGDDCHRDEGCSSGLPANNLQTSQETV